MDTNQIVLTTDELAQAFGVASNNLIKNFQRHKAEFLEEVHYYFLEGEKLKQFLSLKNGHDAGSSAYGAYDVESSAYEAHDAESSASKAGISERSPSDKFVSRLYLWTVKGAFVHAWILKSFQAKQAYEKLVDQVMQRDSSVHLQAQVAQLTQANLELIKQQNETMHLLVQTLQEHLDAGGDILNPDNRLMQAEDLEDWRRAYMEFCRLLRSLRDTRKLTPAQYQEIQRVIQKHECIFTSHLAHLEEREPITEEIWTKASAASQLVAKQQQLLQENMQTLQETVQQLLLPATAHRLQIEAPSQIEER